MPHARGLLVCLSSSVSGSRSEGGARERGEGAAAISEVIRETLLKSNAQASRVINWGRWVRGAPALPRAQGCRGRPSPRGRWAAHERQGGAGRHVFKKRSSKPSQHEGGRLPASATIAADDEQGTIP